MYGARLRRFPRDITRMQHPIPGRLLSNVSDRELECLEHAINEAIQSRRTGPYHYMSLEESLLNIEDIRNARTGMFEGDSGYVDEDEEFEREMEELSRGMGGRDYGHPRLAPGGMRGAPVVYPGMGPPPMYGFHVGSPMAYGMLSFTEGPYGQVPMSGRSHGPIPGRGTRESPYSPSGFSGVTSNPYISNPPPQPPRKEGPNLYKALGLTRSATEEDIAREGKRLKMQWHPDRNKEEGAEEKFKLINEATEVLSDEGRRRYYDKTGDTNLNAFEAWEEARRRFEAGRDGRGGRGRFGRE